MTDVRLTALNPEDSKVYPVACNSSGELLTVKQGDDPIVSGNLTVEGSIIASGGAEITRQSAAQTVLAGFLAPGAASTFKVVANGDVTTDGAITADGSITSEDGVQCYSPARTTERSGLYLGQIFCSRGTKDSEQMLRFIGGYGSANQEDVVVMTSDGSVRFAGNKAGFTAEGYLWCTTRRGDTVILDATSNGLATWADYTPPTRRDVIADKLDAKPGVSQDLPETE